MLTTLYCDASFCPDFRVGGWAVWLRSERGRHIEAGPTPDYCNYSDDAELSAIYAGIYRAVTIWPGTSAVLVRSDCQPALDRMEGRYQSRRQSGRRLQRKIAELQRKHGVRLIPRWVKAHRMGTEVDIYLNNQVDERARNVMFEQRRAAREGRRE